MKHVQALKRVVPRRLWPYLGAVRRWVRARATRTQLQKKRLLSDVSLSLSSRELLEKVSSRIHYNDGMYKGDGAHYYRVGLSAIDCIEQALTAAKLNTMNNVLDLPCGHGRVLRFLLHRFPKARLVACDLDRDGVEFCAKFFGAEAAYSEPDLSELELGREFDLIWCGSLVTHLDDKKIRELLDFFSRHLIIGGLVIFTAPGGRVVELMTSGEFDYGIDPEAIPIIVKSYRETGFGYTDYPYMGEYGISLTSRDWIRNEINELGSLREVYYQPHGWDNHQDVYGFVKDGLHGTVA